MPKTLALAALALLSAGLPVRADDSFATQWAAGAKSEVRLVAARGDLAGLEIRLAPGAVTYWRDPGDAGLPPTFDFAGSANLASAAPVFPAPKRIPEADGGVAYGYDSAVTFPIRVVAADAAEAGYAQARGPLRRLRKNLPARPGAPSASRFPST